MNYALALIIAVIIDLLVGDPRWLPHPVRLMGGLAARAEKWCKGRITNEYLAGITASMFVLAATFLSVAALLYGCRLLTPWLSFFASCLLLAQSIATRDMLGHSRAVYKALVEPAGGLASARKRLAMIVGRDTADLSESGISRACVESVAESFSDGVVAPLFWALIGAITGFFIGVDYEVAAVCTMLYKAVNTLDSMYGYKSDRYLKFGRFAARLDDLANFIPARLAAVTLILVALLPGYGFRTAVRVFFRDRHNHSSPNSGHPEAAMAGALNITLGGPASYFGVRVDKPLIGDPGLPASPCHITKANWLLFAASFLSFLLNVCLYTTCFLSFPLFF